VLEHAFGRGDPYTLGAVADDGEHVDRIHAELMQSVLEVTTPVCRTAADAYNALSQLRGYVAEIARSEGCRFGSAGTHPFSLFERQRITARDRYRQLVDQLQYIARRELIFGMHMHVAVDDPEKVIQVMNGLLVHLPQLLALSANSPFWRGEPTGLSSSRQMIFAAFPRSGPPPRFKDYADYAEVVGQLERTGCIADYTHIWWDIRPHPRLGTIEMRVCDAVTRLEDVVAIAAFFQAIVKMYCEQYDAGKEIPSWHRMLTTENKWLAARYGLEAPVMDLAFQPSTHRLALSLRTAASSEVRVVDVDRPGHARLLFAGPGAFGDIAWSPDGRWLLVGWPTADQWLFLRGSRVHAVSNIREQFPRHDQKAPLLEFDSRWCCTR
jgi:carboxylate-amine ligase